MDKPNLPPTPSSLVETPPSPPPPIILGDKSMSRSDVPLLTLPRSSGLTSSEQAANSATQAVRANVERAFGSLKQSFKILNAPKEEEEESKEEEQRRGESK